MGGSIRMIYIYIVCEERDPFTSSAALLPPMNRKEQANPRHKPKTAIVATQLHFGPSLFGLEMWTEVFQSPFGGLRSFVPPR